MKKHILFWLLAVIGYGSKAQTIQSLEKDMYGIASDATEGRLTSSPGYLMAAHYVINELKAAGIKPGWTTGNGKMTYLQPIPFIRDDYTGSAISVNGIAYRHSGYKFVIAQPGVSAKMIEQSPFLLATAGKRIMPVWMPPVNGLCCRGQTR